MINEKEDLTTGTDLNIADFNVVSLKDCSSKIVKAIESNLEVNFERRPPDTNIYGVDVWLVRNSDKVYLSKDMTLVWMGVNVLKYLTVDYIITSDYGIQVLFFSIESNSDDLKLLQDKLGVSKSSRPHILRICVSLNGDILYNSDSLSPSNFSESEVIARRVALNNIRSSLASVGNSCIASNHSSMEVGNCNNNNEQSINIFERSYVIDKLLKKKFVIISMYNEKRALQVALLCKIDPVYFYGTTVHNGYKLINGNMSNLDILFKDIAESMISISSKNSSAKLAMYISSEEEKYFLSVVIHNTHDIRIVVKALSIYFTMIALRLPAVTTDKFSYIYEVEETEVGNFCTNKNLTEYYKESWDAYDTLYEFEGTESGSLGTGLKEKNFTIYDFISSSPYTTHVFNVDNTYTFDSVEIIVYRLRSSVMSIINNEIVIKSLYCDMSSMSTSQGLKWVVDTVNAAVNGSNVHEEYVFLLEIVNSDEVIYPVIKVFNRENLMIQHIKPLEADLWGALEIRLYSIIR